MGVSSIVVASWEAPQASGKAMKLFRLIFGSSIGRKIVMAVTGLALVGFVTGHMVGNLQFFLGPEAINRYAAFLQGTGELLWVVRLGLLACVGLHVWAAVMLTLENRAARPVRYEEPKPLWASYASRTMIWSGFIIAAFVVYHLLHFTVQAESINFTGTDFKGLHETVRDGSERHDVHRMMILGFRQPAVSLFYAVGVGLLCFHLGHGIGAMFNSLGLVNKAWRPLIDKLSVFAAWVLFVGYVSIPLSVLLLYGKDAAK